jgi:membrane protease YdiL (CAAX protease family)
MKKISLKILLKKAGWSAIRITAGCIICFIIPFTLKSLIIKPVIKLLGLNLDISIAICSPLVFVALLLTYKLYFNKTERREIEELRLFSKFKESAAGFTAGILAISSVFGILSIIGVFQIVGAQLSAKIFSVFLFILASAGFEEVLFRGIIYRILMDDFGIGKALIISSLLFSIPHIMNPNATIISILSAGLGGIIAGLFFSITRNLWFVILFHAGWNFTQVLFGTALSGIEEFSGGSIFRSRLNGTDILTGGKFGPENSIITIGILILIVLYLSIVLTRKDALKAKQV